MLNVLSPAPRAFPFWTRKTVRRFAPNVVAAFGVLGLGMSAISLAYAQSAGNLKMLVLSIPFALGSVLLIGAWVVSLFRKARFLRDGLEVHARLTQVRKIGREEPQYSFECVMPWGESLRVEVPVNRCLDRYAPIVYRESGERKIVLLYDPRRRLAVAVPSGWTNRAFERAWPEPPAADTRPKAKRLPEAPRRMGDVWERSMKSASRAAVLAMLLCICFGMLAEGFMHEYPMFYFFAGLCGIAWWMTGRQVRKDRRVFENGEEFRAVRGELDGPWAIRVGGEVVYEIDPPQDAVYGEDGELIIVRDPETRERLVVTRDMLTS